MDFRQLEVFAKVVEYKNFSRAAEQLFLTQSTVSTHINSLEKKLNIKLFDRRGKNIELTPSGQILYIHAVKILKARHIAMEELKNFAGTIDGELLVYSVSIPAVYILPTLLGRFKNHYPNLIISIRQADSRLVIEAILEDVVEVGITGTCIADKNLEFTPFFSDELVLVTPYDYTLGEAKKSNGVYVKDFINERFIIREKNSGTRITFENELDKKGIKFSNFNIVAELGSTEAIINAVKAGVGVSIVSNMAVKDYEKMNYVRAFPIKDLKLSRSFYLVNKNKKTLSPNANAFKKLILSS